MKREILILIPHYLPGYKIGGPLTSIKNMIDHISSHFHFSLLTSDRDLGDNLPFKNIRTNTWQVVDQYRIYYLRKNVFSIFRFITIINKSKPQILYISGLFTPFFSIYPVFLNKLGIIRPDAIVVAPKGELYLEALKYNSLKKAVYLSSARKLKFYKNIYFQASSAEEKQMLIDTLKIKPIKIAIAPNLPRKMNQVEEAASQTMTKVNNDVINLAFISRIAKGKNLEYAFDILSKVSAKTKFRIYGPIEDQYVWDLCLKKAGDLPSNVTYEYMGVADRDEVCNILMQNDLLFFPTSAENFGHVISESLSVGTPVLISDNTPWKDLVSDGLGWDINLDSPEKFIEVLNKKLPETKKQSTREQRLKIIKSYHERLDTEKIINDHLSLFSDVCETR